MSEANNTLEIGDLEIGIGMTGSSQNEGVGHVLCVAIALIEIAIMVGADA
ncbi:MAG: hypothetical protein AAF296_06925 [Pseudomonadota bacterium]